MWVFIILVSCVTCVGQFANFVPYVGLACHFLFLQRSFLSFLLLAQADCRVSFLVEAFFVIFSSSVAFCHFFFLDRSSL